MTEGTGYTLDGDSAVTKEQDYCFTVNLNYGYRKGSNFKVLVNNVELAPTGEFYVVSAVSGDIVVTVEGVEPITESYWIVLDGDVDSAEYTAATLLQKYLPSRDALPIFANRYMRLAVFPVRWRR